MALIGLRLYGGRQRRVFRAYSSDGRLALSTWTSAAGPYEAEKAAYQARLNRCELMKVVVSSDDPSEPVFTMLPQSVT